METAQIDTGTGPGIETARTGDDVAIADLGTVVQPSEWAGRLRAAGAGAVAAFARVIDATLKVTISPSSTADARQPAHPDRLQESVAPLHNDADRP